MVSTTRTPSIASLPPQAENLRSVLIEGETLLAWALQRRIFALSHRRAVIAATNNRFIALARGLFGGFELTDLRWQDLREAKVRVGILGADLTLVAGAMSDLASGGGASRVLNYIGFDKEFTEQIYRIAQGQDQAWREKRRIRELDEMRARSGGVQIGSAGGPAAVPPSPAADIVARLQQAKQMLDAKLISDSEYEAIKARVINTV
ncbi:MAG: hypothetical protein ABSF50_11075 [Burkholderiaceae bacterium]|jgi:hypothetical protein